MSTRRQQRRFAISVAALISFSLCATERIVTFSANENSAFSNRNAQGLGCFPEIVSAAYKTQGIKAEYGFYPIARATAMASRGSVDGVIDIGVLESLSETLDPSKEPVLMVDIVLVSLKSKGLTFSGDTQELKKHSISVEHGTVVQEYLFKLGLKPERATSSTQNIKKLLAGRMDYVAGPRLTLEKAVRELSAGQQLTFQDIPLFQNKKYVLFSRNAPGYKTNKALFEAGFDEIKKNGTLMEIVRTHNCYSHDVLE